MHIQINGVDEIRRKLGEMTAELEDTIQAAGEESGKMLLREEGLQKYPPVTEANRPPPPYYERGRGMWINDTVNLGNSERLGTQWVIERAARYATRIGNSASYAPYVHGIEQAHFMADKGWRRLDITAEEKIQDIIAIYQAWIDRLARRLFD